MLIEVIGASGSGKSAFAEKLCCSLCPGEKYYIATMSASGAEGEARVKRHRENRAGLNFRTVECPAGLERIRLPEGAVLLLEDLPNLLANEMYGPEGRMRDPGENLPEILMKEIHFLLRQADSAVVVTGQVFSDGIEYDSSTMEYMRLLAELNSRLASEADEVYEVVCGIPIVLRADPGKADP